MKKLLLPSMFVVVSLLSIINADATIRRVGYFGPPITGTDYTTLQSAHDAASAGDTLLMFPGSWGATFSKKLIVIGYGYSASALDSGLQNIKGTIGVSLTMNGGSKGTIIRGIDGLSLSSSMISNNAVDSITINRCAIASLAFGSSNISTVTGFKGWQITQSVINNLYFSQFNNSYIYAPVTQLLISNCIITNITFGGSASGSCNGTFINNIFQGGTNSVNFNNSSFTCTNDVFLCPNFLNAAACTFSHNIATTNILPLNNGNQVNVPSNTIFVGYPTQGTYSNDGRFALAANSPASGGGEGGTDCGVFGGTIPYRLGGIPPIPSFYKLTAPSTTTSGNPYTITFSVRSNN